jgi:predicted transcriptional regulator
MQGADMSKLKVQTGTAKDFFERGRAIAAAADRLRMTSANRQPTLATLQASEIISFEDPADLVKLLSAARLALLRMVKTSPGSITELAQRLQRDRSAVKRDIDELANAGLILVQEKPSPGHGRIKHVQLRAQRFSLQAEFV